MTPPVTDEEAAFGEVADSMTVWLRLLLADSDSVGGEALFLVVAGKTCFFLGLDLDGGRAAISGNSESESLLLESGSDSEDDEKIVFLVREDGGGGRDGFSLAIVFWVALSFLACLGSKLYFGFP